MEDEASQLKRKAIRALMSDKSLDPAERTKQIQLILSGKVKPGGAPTQQQGSAAAASSTTASKSLPCLTASVTSEHKTLCRKYSKA